MHVSSTSLQSRWASGPRLGTASAVLAAHARPADRASGQVVMPGEGRGSAATTLGAKGSSRKGGRQGAAAARAGVGVLVTPQVVDGAYVTRAEMQQAVAGMRLLPAADLALLSKHGITIELYPVRRLEGSLVGATDIEQSNGGPWTPVRIRVAVRHNLVGDRTIPEIVQHEIGHAISVLKFQDRSEAAAEAYARRY